MVKPGAPRGRFSLRNVTSPGIFLAISRVGGTISAKKQQFGEFDAVIHADNYCSFKSVLNGAQHLRFGRNRLPGLAQGQHAAG